ncbi:MAG: NADH-dependent [FeFe] hydrogenase, group A6 [Clostridiales bacterium]|nr:NADH-dependent [FeFe] hydrogenase, group A6 [Clostridiales bacterium]
MINLTINNMPITAAEGTTILDAAKLANVNIPTLCHMNFHDINMINQSANCRVCMVEVEGARTLAPACATAVTEGMVIHTNSPRAVNARRAIVELILSDHPKDCLVCEKNLKCELQALAATLNIKEFTPEGKRKSHPKDISNYSLIRDPEKCILCRRCETMCNVVQTVGVYSAINRGFETVIGTAFDAPISETECTYCGQCVSVCPTGALVKADNTREVWKALNDPEKLVVVQTAPAVRVALGELFGLKPGARVTGKMIAALRRLGFDYVMDTNFAADLTVMEEAAELLQRIENSGRFPMLTSCCPAWINFIEFQFPELLDIPSTCRSPHEMFGVVAKTYFAERVGVRPEDMTVVSVMPCLAKKYELHRPELEHHDFANVDYVITTTELAEMIKEAAISFGSLPDEAFDSLMGESSGAAAIFGSTGGVIEATVRTAYERYTNKKLDKIEFSQLRGMEGLREASVDFSGTRLNIAIAHGLGNTRRLLEDIRDGKSEYHAIEIMACPGGCIGGGGQPSYPGKIAGILKKRQLALYEEDAENPIRCAHENKEVLKLYEEFLGEPFGEKAHKLLHTRYFDRSRAL